MNIVITQHNFKLHPHCFLHSITGGNVANLLATANDHTPPSSGIVDTDTCDAMIKVSAAILHRAEFCVVSPNHKAITMPAGTSDYFQALSGGTSGMARRIRRTQQSWTASFVTNAAMFNLDDHDHYAVLGNLSHSLTLYAFLEAAFLGADVSVATDLTATQQLQMINKRSISVLYATPTQLRKLCQSLYRSDQPGSAKQGIGEPSSNEQRSEKHSLDERLVVDSHLVGKQGVGNHSVKAIFCGGGKLDQATASDIRSYFKGADLRVFYGASETSFIAISDAQTPPGSCGKAYPAVDIQLFSKRPIRAVKGCGDIHGKVFEQESERFDKNINSKPCKSYSEKVGKKSVECFGEKVFESSDECFGEVWVKSPYLFSGYVGSDSPNTRRQNGYVSVGEIGRFDSDGNLFLAGRLDRMFTVADQNVFPEDIETLLNTLHNANCAVVAAPDDMRGCIVFAAIEGPHDSLLRKQLLRELREHLGNLVAPRDIQFIQPWPVLRSGKTDIEAVKMYIMQKMHITDKPPQ